MLPVIDLLATGKNITHLVKKRKMTVRFISSRLRVSETAVYKWCKGACLPTIDNLVMLSGLLDVPIGDLIVLKEAAG